MKKWLVALFIPLSVQAAQFNELSLLSQLEPLRVITVTEAGKKITWAKGCGFIRCYCFRLDVAAMANATQDMQEMSLATYVYNNYFNTTNIMPPSERIAWCDQP